MIRTRVGYTGGQKRNPTYHSLGDHTESLQVDYDPQRISYSQLLEIFWASHDPLAQPYSTQYKAAVYFADEQQRELAEQGKRAIEQQTGRPVYTEILPLSEFYRAEDYHQKYYLRHNPLLWPEIAAFYAGDERGLADSTLAARFNGFAGRYGSQAAVEAELDSYGLSAEGREIVAQLAPGLHQDSSGGSCGLAF